MAKDNGIVLIHGKEYQTVASRVQKFREAYKFEYSIETELVSIDESTVVMKATIKNSDGRVVATGYAEESRTASQINRTSALENCETSAIGRCLASAGMAGTEYASADEVANAISQQSSAPAKPSYPKNQVPTTDKSKQYLDNLKFQISGAFNFAGLNQPEEQIAFIEDLIGKRTIDTIDEAKEVLNEVEALGSTSEVSDAELASYAV